MTTQKLTPAEATKVLSQGLRGTIVEELAANTDHFSKPSTLILKHHGTYQQDDRDARAAKKPPAGGKREKAFSFMVRTRIPGGRLTAEQLSAELDLCDEVGIATLRITTRQALQLHGVVKGDLPRTIRRINEVQLTTLAACGDVCRNVMCCPAPHDADPVHEQMQHMASALAERFAPRREAYHEIWLRDPQEDEQRRVTISAADGSVNIESNGRQRQPSTVRKHGEESSTDPLYGQAYLPRKFKTAIGLPGDNCVDVYANDLGLLAICEDYRVVGYNVLVGGGMGVSPSNSRTFPALAKKLAFAQADAVPELAVAIVKVFRDFGCRSDRKRARLKYLLHDWGLDRFREKVEEYFGHSLLDPHDADVTGFDDHLGWHEQRAGVWYVGLNVENGRLADTEKVRWKTAIREILRRVAPSVRLTAHQSLILTDIAEDDRALVETILRENGVQLADEISLARRWSMACPAFPTCGLAITESERALPSVIDDLERELARLGLSQEKFTVRMTGCPNGCARPYNADIGLVGKARGKYTLLLGGRLLGDRLNSVYEDLVPQEAIVATLRPALLFFKHARRDGETFGDFCHRQGMAKLHAWREDLQASEDVTEDNTAQDGDLGIARCA